METKISLNKRNRFLQKHKDLFWYMNKSKINEISDDGGGGCRGSDVGVVGPLFPPLFDPLLLPPLVNWTTLLLLLLWLLLLLLVSHRKSSVKRKRVEKQSVMEE